MFTGIVEALGEVAGIMPEEKNLRLTIRSAISKELSIDQSVAHNGVCLTVVSQSGNEHTVVAVAETLEKTNLDALRPGQGVNLERSMTMATRIDGHMVQGHVDQTIECLEVVDKNGSWEFWFALDAGHRHLIVEKGSVCLNGTSLTVAALNADRFSVAIIPYTYQHTTFHQLKAGDLVNVEYDIIGKYIARHMEVLGQPTG